MTNAYFDLTNIDLFFVAVVAAFMLVIGFAVFISNRKSVTHQAFLYIAISSIIWCILNIEIYESSSPQIVLWLLRALLFSATWFAFSLFHFYYVFPAEKRSLPAWYRHVLIPLTALVSLLTLSPFVFEKITSFSETGRVQNVTNGPAIAIFGLFVGMLIITSFIKFAIQTYRARNEERAAYRTILLGTVITFTLILAFNFIAPAVLGNSSFVQYGPLFIFPFIILTAYAISRHHLFNVKIIATALLVGSVAILTLFDILLSSDPTILIFRLSVFVLVLAVGILLIRGVFNEVEQREVIQKQEVELENVNAQQVSLLHFISHEIKGYLTKSEAGFAAIAQGDFGPVSSDISTMANEALIDVRRGVRTVMDILDASNLKRGTVSYKKDVFDLKDVVRGVVDHLKPAVDEKHLTMNMSLAWEVPCKVSGDEEKIRDHVVRNLVDNAIKYTPTGSITIEVVRVGTIVRFSVQDSGVGITGEDKARLFTEGGHGKDSIKVNVHSTGYGLFIAKTIVESHGGKIWAESQGAGKGSRFVVELPAA